MAVFIVRRTIGLIVVLFAITVLTFLIFFATPGIDPARQLAGRNPTPETIAAVKHQFGLDRSLPVQYALMMKRLFISRDLVSYGNQALEVVPAITSAAPVTFSLVIGAAVLWVFFSILLGLLAVVFRGTILDPLLMILALIGISMPVFWLGEMANLITQDRLHDTFVFSWVPPPGYTPLTQNPWQWFLHLIIPWIVLSVLYIGFYARVLRANLLDIQNEDYIRTARAKGLSPRRVLVKHMLRTSLITFVSLFGLHFAKIDPSPSRGLVRGGAMSRKRRWTWLMSALAVTAGFSLMVAAYGVAANRTKAAPKHSQAFGTLRAVLDTIDYLDPQQSYTAQSVWAMWNVYIPLVTYRHVDGAAGFKVVPGLAATLPKVSANGRVYKFTLRKGLKYSNGKPVKASDFKFAIKREYLSTGQGVGFYTGIVGAKRFEKTLKGDIRGIQVNNARRTIKIRLSSPRGDFLTILALGFAAPVPAGTPSAIQNGTIPSTGPYRISNYTVNEGFTMVRNKYFKPTKYIPRG